ncbi:MAG: type IX secretion system membrane protein PorP/SprF [Elusimicrobia bacterium]|nr:type IX secretion system membrane protein PorP/SprF [Elusimicrobiota bacterium]
MSPALPFVFALSVFLLQPSIFSPQPVFAAFDDLGAGARGPGMGNAMASVADDVYAAHYNPAGLGTLTQPQFTAAYTQHYMGLTDDSNLGTSFFGYAQPIAGGRRGTLAGALNSFTLNGSLYRENTLYLSYGRRICTRPGGAELFMGTTLKYLYSSFGYFTESADATSGISRTGQPDPLLSGNLTRKAFDADLGLLYRFMTHYQLGLQVAHLTRPDMALSSGDSDRVPADIKLGFNYKSLISNLVAQAETKKAPDGKADNIFTVAAERWFPKAFVGDLGVRGAMGMGTRDYKQFSLGLSYRNRRVQLDYGFSLPLGTIASTSGSHRMAITFHFGKPGEQEETLEMLMEALRNLKTPPAAEVRTTTVTVFVTPELSAIERAIAEKLSRSEEAIKDGRYREAVSLSSSIIDLDPKAAAAWQNMGIAYLGMEKYKNSLYAWNKAYEYEKSLALKKAIKGYINSISRLARSAAAPKPAEPAAAPRPVLSREEIEKMLDLGVNYYANKEIDKAREIFEQVLEAEPDNSDALSALRRLKDEKGR